MSTRSPFIKALLVAVTLSVLTYVGLEVPKDSVEEVIDAGLETFYDEEVQSVGESYVVQQVIDGDTLKVVIDSIAESVRVVGIDTPETKYSSRGAECFGAEASAYAKTLLEDTTIQLTPDASQDARDKYDRVLAFVTMSDGRDFGEVMIADGYAYEYTYQGVPHKNQQLYKDAQKLAQENRVGLWKEGACDLF